MEFRGGGMEFRGGWSLAGDGVYRGMEFRGGWSLDVGGMEFSDGESRRAEGVNGNKARLLELEIEQGKISGTNKWYIYRRCNKCVCNKPNLLI